MGEIVGCMRCGETEVLIASITASDNEVITLCSKCIKYFIDNVYVDTDIQQTLVKNKVKWYNE